MTKYYNTTRGPLSASLTSGKTIIMPPKRWTEIDSRDEGSASLIPLLGRGYLKRSTIPTTPASDDSPPTSVEK